MTPSRRGAPSRGYLFPFACFECRRSFRRPWTGIDDRPCPNCGAPTGRLSRKFKAPPADDTKQWEKVRFLVEHGFYFWTVYDADGLSVPYPGTLEEARTFVTRYTPRAPHGVSLKRRSRKLPHPR